MIRDNQCTQCEKEKIDYSTVSMVFFLRDNGSYGRIEDTTYCDMHGLLIDGKPIIKGDN